MGDRDFFVDIERWMRDGIVDRISPWDGDGLPILGASAESDTKARTSRALLGVSADADEDTEPNEDGLRIPKRGVSDSADRGFLADEHCVARFDGWMNQYWRRPSVLLGQS